MNKAVFLDRDGVLNELVYYAKAGIADTPINASQIKLIFGGDKLINDAKKIGFLVIIISNQPSIGLKKIKEKDFKAIHKKITELLLRKSACLNASYYCFHHPFAKLSRYKKICTCRKPKAGLFKKASKDFDIDLSQSWMIGDGVDDIKAGKKAGCKTILLANINSTENLRIMEKQLGKIKPDFVVKNLIEASEIIKTK